jgi:hypothetical protein
MENIITEVINDYLKSKCMINENFYWGEGDLRAMRNCKKTLSEVYDRMLKNGLTKNVFVVQQLGDIINRLDNLSR